MRQFTSGLSSGKWQVAGGRWQVASCRWQVAGGRVLVVLLLAVAALVAVPVVAFADPPPAHQFIQEYNGPRTCETCHLGATEQVMNSAHYTWSGKLEHYSPLPGAMAGNNWLDMLNPELGIAGGCGSCHVGGGAMPGAAMPESVAGQVDCLICHAGVYDLSLRAPVQDEDGAWLIPGDRSVEAARSAARPTDEMCLRCHVNLGGSEIVANVADPAPIADWHATVARTDVHRQRGVACVDCHRAPEHRFYGFAPTLWSRDREDDRLSCAGCHSPQPHASSILNDHRRLDCRTCHLTETGGVMARDWTAAGVFDPETGLYLPADTVAAADAVQPAFFWHNGQRLGSDLSLPGSYGDLNSFIQPFKIFEGVVPGHAVTGRPWPLKLPLFYLTGDVEQAIVAGAAEVGLAYDGTWAARTLQVPFQLSHGIGPASEALACAECHVPDGRIDFAALGYNPTRVALLESLSRPDNIAARPLQVDFPLPQASGPPPVRSDEPLTVAEPGFIGRLVTWSVWGALVIVLLVFLAVALLMRYAHRRFAS